MLSMTGYGAKACPCLTTPWRSRSPHRSLPRPRRRRSPSVGRNAGTVLAGVGLGERGLPGHAIATHLRIGKSTVFRYLRTATLPERMRRSDRGRSVLDPYKPYLLERWNAGCHDALRLWDEIQRRGYPGSYTTVARYAQWLRQAQGQAPQQRPAQQTLPVVVGPRQPLLTARQAAWIALRREEPHAEDEALCSPSCVRSMLTWPRPSISPRPLPDLGASVRVRSWMLGWLGSRRVPLWPCNGLPKVSLTIMTPSKLG